MSFGFAIRAWASTILIQIAIILIFMLFAALIGFSMEPLKNKVVTAL